LAWLGTGENDGAINRHPLRPIGFDAGILSCSPADPPRLVGWKSLSRNTDQPLTFRRQPSYLLRDRGRLLESPSGTVASAPSSTHSLDASWDSCESHHARLTCWSRPDSQQTGEGLLVRTNPKRLLSCELLHALRRVVCKCVVVLFGIAPHLHRTVLLSDPSLWCRPRTNSSGS